MILLLLLFAAFCASVLFALHFYFKTGKDRPFEERFVIAATPVLVVLMVMRLSYSVIRMPDRDWNAARITPSVAWTKGYDVYYPKDEGPILNTLYGPGTVLAFAPSAMGKDPTAALLIAGMINVGAMALPLLILLRMVRSRDDDIVDQTARWLTWVLCCAGIYLYFGTAYAINSIHADSPAMGMMIIACTIIILAKDALSLRRLTLGAFVAALACFTKQIEVFALPGLFFYIGLAFRWRSAFIYAGLVASWAGVLALAFGATMGGLQDMMFNIVTVPSLHEWKGPKVSILMKSGLSLALAGTFLLLLLLPFVFRAFHGKKLSLASMGETLKQHRWILFVFIAVTMIPGCLMGEVKIGGMENSYHTLYYLLAGLGLVTYRWISSAEGDRRQVSLMGTYLVAALIIGLQSKELVNLLRARSVWNNAQQEVFEFAKKHPGEAIFPWNPLSTLYADGKVYHFEYGVYDRVFSDFSPTQEHFDKHLPENLKYIIWRNRRECFQIPQFLPEFSKRTNVKSLADPLDKPIVAPPPDPMEPPELNEPSATGWMIVTRP